MWSWGSPWGLWCDKNHFNSSLKRSVINYIESGFKLYIFVCEKPKLCNFITSSTTTANKLIFYTLRNYASQLCFSRQPLFAKMPAEWTRMKDETLDGKNVARRPDISFFFPFSSTLPSPRVNTLGIKPAGSRPSEDISEQTPLSTRPEKILGGAS